MIHINRILVLATSFLESLPTYSDEAEAPRIMLEDSAARKGCEVEYRCKRNPLKPMTLGELKDVVAVIADLEQWSAELISSAGNEGKLGLIARYGIGYNSVDIVAAKEAGVMVTNTPAASAQPTAEWAVAMLLATAGRMLPQSYLGGKGLGKRGPSRLDVRGKTLGIIGTGTIGKQVARLLSGFDMKILSSDPYPDHDWAETTGAEYTDIADLCGRADFITLHASGSDILIGPEEIRKMKSSSVLINCARGIFTDNVAAHKAVKEGRLFGFSLDESWPHHELPLSPELNIAATPHIGSDSDFGKLRMRQMSVESVVEFIEGKEPRYLVSGRK